MYRTSYRVKAICANLRHPKKMSVTGIAHHEPIPRLQLDGMICSAGLVRAGVRAYRWLPDVSPVDCQPSRPWNLRLVIRPYASR